MSTVSAEIRYDPKDDAWFTANATMVLKNGEPAIHVTTGLYKMGDDSTQLQNLPWLPVISSGGQVNSVVGVTNRITVNSADPVNPIVNIDPNYDAALISYIQDQLDTVIRDMGTWDASGNLFPTIGGSGSGGAIEAGNQFRVSVNGTLGGTAVTAPYSYFRALVDSPGQTAANWYVVPATAPAPSTTANRKIVLYNNTNSAVTGTTSRTILTPDTFVIAPGVMGLNSVLEVQAFLRKSGTAGNCVWELWANTSYSLTGAKLIATSGSIFTTTTQTMGFVQRLANKNSLSLNNQASISSFTGDTPSTNGFTSPNVNWGVLQYLMLSATPGNSGDTNTLDNIQIYINNP